mgnify:CR=1 FL=1
MEDWILVIYWWIFRQDFYLITKRVKAISAEENTTTFTVPISDTEYPYIVLNNDNVIEITSIEDNNGNKWYEVPYLAQETIFVEKPNTESNGGSLSESSSVVPYILEVQKVPRRFSVKVNSDNTMDLQFGNGTFNGNDEILIPNTKNVGLGTANAIQRLNQGIDPSNFLKTNTLGIAPNGKTLNIKYLKGGGVTSNVNQGDLTLLTKIEFDDDLLSIIDLQYLIKLSGSTSQNIKILASCKSLWQIPIRLRHSRV